VRVCSRNQKSLGKRFPLIVEGLVDVPDETVIDGEINAVTLVPEVLARKLDARCECPPDFRPALSDAFELAAASKDYSYLRQSSKSD
jgi:hypothetical protein